MRKFDHVWSYACVDLDPSCIDPPTIEHLMQESEYVAQMAVDAGVDIMEVGTPLCYGVGYRAIERFRSVLGPDFPLVADLKAQDRVGFLFDNCRKYGADYSTVCVVGNDGGLAAAIEAGKRNGIKVIADLYATPIDQLVRRAKESEAMGADIVQLHFGYDEHVLGVYPGRRDSDYVKEVAEAVDLPVFVVANEEEDVARAIRDGASGILFGFTLLDNSRESFEKTKAFVDNVHKYDRLYNG